MKRETGSVQRQAWGFTLIEVVVVLALLGLMAGVTGIALGSLAPTPESQTLAELRRARAEAIRTGRPVVVGGSVRFFPDGSARGPGLHLLTGAPHGEP